LVRTGIAHQLLPDHCVCLEFEDLTDQRKAARTISNQAQLLDLVTDAIFARDMDGRVTYWNQSAKRMYGWTKEEVLGQSTFELLKTECPFRSRRFRRYCFVTATGKANYPTR